MIRSIYLLRHRADRDGFTLMRGDLAVAGGSLHYCLHVFTEAARVTQDETPLAVTPEVARHVLEKLSAKANTPPA